MPATAVLFVCLPMEGHIRPLAQVAAALQQLGSVAVDFAACEQSRQTIEALAPHVSFHSLGELSEEETRRAAVAFDTSRPIPPLPQRAVKAAEMFTVLEEALYPAVRALLAKAAGRYAVLVTDQATLAAHDAAEEVGLPLVILPQLPLSYALVMAGQNASNMCRSVPVEMPGCVAAETMGWWQATFTNPRAKKHVAALFTDTYARHRRPVRSRLGLPPLPPGSGPLEPPPGIPAVMHIAGGVMELEVERKLPPGWHMSGPQGLPVQPPVLDGGKHPAVAAFLQAAADAGESVVYCALGTLVAPHAALTQAMAAAFEAVPGVRFVWALKQASQAFLPAHLLPQAPASSGSRVLVVPWAPQAAVLAHPAVQLFVTHGGLGSLHEGLAAGTPLLTMPFFADQHINAQRMVNRRLGVTVDPCPTAIHSLPHRLSTAISAMLADTSMAERAAEVGQRLRSMNGSEMAAGLILQFINAAAEAGKALSA